MPLRPILEQEMGRLKAKKIYALCVIPLVLTVSGTSAMQSWQSKHRFADPPRGNESYAAAENNNKQRAIAWVNSNDPRFVALRAEIERSFPLWARSNAVNVAPDSFTISPGRFAGELNVSYAINQANGQKYRNTIQAQMVDGYICLGNATSLYKTCDDMPSSQAEADRSYATRVARNAQTAQEIQHDKQEAAMITAGSRTRRPGSPLNQGDEACMKTISENYQAYEQGQCTSGYATRLDNGAAGPYVCSSYESKLVTRTRSYEKNVCSRPISFRDQCGSTIFGSYTVQPGARFDRKFGYPCGRVY